MDNVEMAIAKVKLSSDWLTHINTNLWLVVTRCVLARSTPALSLKEKKIIFNLFARTWRERRQKSRFYFTLWKMFSDWSLSVWFAVQLSLCRWLTETLETLMKERSVDESKAESAKLKEVMERHKSLIPKIRETLVKTECYWKCYSYGDDLIPIFEFIDDLRNRFLKEAN